MARTLLVLLGLLLTLAGGGRFAAEPAGQERAMFRSGVRTVPVYATVNDAEGRLVPDLDRSAFRILDDGRPVETTIFSNAAQPITVAIMLDMSKSMITKVFRVRDSTERFIDAMTAGDRTRIGTFGSEVAVSPLLTDDKRVLRRVLREELWPGGQTPLWRGLLAGMTSLEAEAGRRVVLVLTDGNDADPFPSPPGSKVVKQRAVRDGFMVYAIGMERTTGKATTGAPSSGWMFTGGLSAEIVDVVEETGGGHFELQPGVDLGDTFLRVVEELRQQYLLGFSPASLDGKPHKLDVQVIRPGCKARARKSYVAQEER